LPIKYKPKHPKEGRNTRNKNGRTTSKKTKEPSKRAKNKGNIKVPEPSWVMMRSISNKERGGGPI
jgi:hypothetical protein